MTTTITGIVTNGLVVPNAPLPEGARVEIRLQPPRLEVPPELQEEFDGWERAGAGTVELVERLAEENETNDAKRRVAGAHSRCAGGRGAGGSPARTGEPPAPRKLPSENGRVPFSRGPTMKLKIVIHREPFDGAATAMEYIEEVEL